MWPFCSHSEPVYKPHDYNSETALQEAVKVYLKIPNPDTSVIVKLAEEFRQFLKKTD